MKEIAIEKKLNYLLEHYPFYPVPKLTDKRYCAHCKKEILVGEYKVFRNDKNETTICCPNAPDCDGTVLDWMKIS